MSSQVTLVTGANRGIGRGLVAKLLLRSANTVVATVRDTTAETAKTLTSLPKAEGSKLIVLKLDQQKDGDDAATKAISKLKTEHPEVTALDVVIANAGIAKYYGPATDTPLSEMRDHFEVNVVAPISLFQATWPLLQASATPKFVGISTAIASLGQMEESPLPATAYGGSKAMLNYFILKAHFENPSLIAFPIAPGWVQTDMGNAGAAALGKDAAPNTLEESVAGILKKIDDATREKTSGHFLDFSDTEWEW